MFWARLKSIANRVRSALRSDAYSDTLRVLELVGIMVVVVALIISYFQQRTAIEQSRLAADALHHQRIAAAWQLLAIRGAGATGKQYALSTLFELEGSISHIDLSCRAFGEVDDEGNCQRRPDLSRLTLDASEARARFQFIDSSFEFTDLSLSRFAHVDFNGISLRGADLTGAEFYNSNLTHVDVRGARLGAITVQDSAWSSVDASNAVLTFINTNSVGTWNWTGDVRFSNDIHVSNADFCPADPQYPVCQWQELPEDFWRAIWFYEGSPPQGLDGIGEGAMVRRPCPRQEPAVAGPVFEVPNDCPEIYIPLSDALAMN